MLRWTFRREPRQGRPIRGEVRVPDGPPPRSAVVLAHGFRGWADWSFLPWVADALVGAGHVVVSFDFSGSVQATAEEAFRDNTFSLEVEELERVVAWVRSGELAPRSPHRVGLLGYSRGGADAVLCTAGTAQVDALVTWAAVARLDRWSDDTVARWRQEGEVYVLDGQTGRQRPLGVALLEDFEAHREALDVEAAASRVTVPWLIVHGTQDHTVEVGEARVLARQGPRTRLLLVEGAGHTLGAEHPFQGPGSALRQALEATLAHFARHLSEPSS